MIDWNYGSSLNSYAGARFCEKDKIVDHFMNQMRIGAPLSLSGLSLMFSYSNSELNDFANEALRKLNR